MTDLLLLNLYYLPGLLLVWYTWPGLADAKVLRLVSAPFMIVAWPLYVLVGLGTGLCSHLTE